jgi:hypothetical protein
LFAAQPKQKDAVSDFILQNTVGHCWCATISFLISSILFRTAKIMIADYAAKRFKIEMEEANIVSIGFNWSRSPHDKIGPCWPRSENSEKLMEEKQQRFHFVCRDPLRINPFCSQRRDQTHRPTFCCRAAKNSENQRQKMQKNWT